MQYCIKNLRNFRTSAVFGPSDMTCLQIVSTTLLPAGAILPWIVLGASSFLVVVTGLSALGSGLEPAALH